MKTIIYLILVFTGLTFFSYFQSFGQNLSGNNNETITGKWTFENGTNFYGSVNFHTNNLKAVHIQNETINSRLQIGIAEGNGHYNDLTVVGDIVLRKLGLGKKLIIGNGYTLNHPNNLFAVTGLMGASTGGGIWVHNNGNIRLGEYNATLPSERLVVEGAGLFESNNWGQHIKIKRGAYTGQITMGLGGDMYLSGDGINFPLMVVGDNVGIGTTATEHKLDVAGTIRATEIKVEAQTADFVFEGDYNLRSLAEVENFIKENKHLPDIPSASQMEAEGVNLAEMNKLLLMKVEELTLYLIHQQKLIDKLLENK